MLMLTYCLICTVAFFTVGIWLGVTWSSPLFLIAVFYGVYAGFQCNSVFGKKRSSKEAGYAPFGLLPALLAFVLPVPYCWGIFQMLQSEPSAPEVALSRRMPGKRGLTLRQANQYLAAAESQESSGDYANAEKHYRAYVHIMQQYYPEACFDGIIARILDLQGKHKEAADLYSKVETFYVVKRKREKPGASTDKKGSETGRADSRETIAADGRLLRILQLLPRDKAEELFPYAKEILGAQHLSAAKLGRNISILHLSPSIRDYRSASTHGQEIRDVKSLAGEVGAVVVQDKILSRMLAKLSKSDAERKFNFGADFHPESRKVISRDEVPTTRVPGYGKLAGPKDLLPIRLAVVRREDYAALQSISAHQAAAVPPRNPPVTPAEVSRDGRLIATVPQLPRSVAIKQLPRGVAAKQRPRSVAVKQLPRRIAAKQLPRRVAVKQLPLHIAIKQAKPRRTPPPPAPPVARVSSEQSYRNYVQREMSTAVSVDRSEEPPARKRSVFHTFAKGVSKASKKIAGAVVSGSSSLADKLGLRD